MGAFIVRVIGFASLVCSHAAFLVAHASGWFPDDQLARLLMASPGILQIEVAQWVLTAVLAITFWAVADYFLYRRHSRASKPEAFKWSSGILEPSGKANDPDLPRKTNKELMDYAINLASQMRTFEANMEI